MDFGPLNKEPRSRMGTAPGMARRSMSKTANTASMHNMRVKALTPAHSGQKARKAGNRQLRHPNSYQQGVDPNGYIGPRHRNTNYQGTLRYKGQSVKYLKYDEDKWNRHGYWPNCRERSERWDNYRSNQWEDNRFESSSSPKQRKKQHEKRSNRMPFQSTPYSEQSPTMLFYQQKLHMSKSMPMLRNQPSRDIDRTKQEERIFDFAQTQEILTGEDDLLADGVEGLELDAALEGQQPEEEEEELPTTARREEAEGEAVAY